MKVSKFKNARTSQPSRYSADVVQVLREFKEGRYQVLIDEVNNGEMDKQSLPAISFGGTFKDRRIRENLKQASGFMVLDFDHLEDAEQFRDDLKTDPYIFSAWVSVSGNGVKALVKIPVVFDFNSFSSYYKAYQASNYTNALDASGKDITRLCFVCSDNGLWINEDSLIFDQLPDEVMEDEVKDLFPVITVSIPLTDTDKVVSILLRWFQKKYNPQQRNNSINILAYSMNLFGVPQERAARECLNFEQKDFKKSEILATVRSAYSKSELFGSKQFSDDKKVNDIQSFSRKKGIDKTKEVFAEIAPQVIEQICSEVDNEAFEDFWKVSEKGVYSLKPYEFKLFLESNGFFKVAFQMDVKVVTFIKKTGKFVREVSEVEIKDFVLSFAESIADIELYNFLSMRSKFFSQEFLTFLDSKTIEVLKDTVDTSYIYFQNCILKVQKDQISQINYEDSDLMVWEKQVIQREYTQTDHHNSDFRSFLWFACGQDKESYNTFKSVFGYYLHTYKDLRNNKAIVSLDQDMSENPNGGSGKSILMQAIGQIRKVAEINGKQFDFNKTFPYQLVSLDSQIINFDDVKKDFKFENLFSEITSGISIEYKGKQAVKLPLADSPKIYISTNYTLKGEGGSFKRRKMEIIFSNYFNAENTLIDVFGKLFFNEWDNEEWACFDAYAINCLQYFMQNGLIPQSGESIREKQFVNATSRSWYEWVKQNPIKTNERIYFKELKHSFLERNDHFKDFSTQRLRTWVEAYAKHEMLNITADKDNIGYYFELNPGSNKIEQTKDMNELNEWK